MADNDSVLIEQWLARAGEYLVDVDLLIQLIVERVRGRDESETTVL